MNKVELLTSFEGGFIELNQLINKNKKRFNIFLNFPRVVKELTYQDSIFFSKSSFYLDVLSFLYYHLDNNDLSEVTRIVYLIKKHESKLLDDGQIDDKKTFSQLETVYNELYYQLYEIVHQFSLEMEQKEVLKSVEEAKKVERILIEIENELREMISTSGGVRYETKNQTKISI